MATRPQQFEQNKTTEALIDELSENQAQFAIKAILVAGKLAENEVRDIVAYARTWIERE